jgi:HTH-type transcriptional regulator/antitoxin HigA
MIAIADILQAGEKLTAVAPFLAGIQNEEQYTQALELVDHLLLNDPENPLLDLVCGKNQRPNLRNLMPWLKPCLAV